MRREEFYKKLGMDYTVEEEIENIEKTLETIINFGKQDFPIKIDFLMPRIYDETRHIERHYESLGWCVSTTMLDMEIY